MARPSKLNSELITQLASKFIKGLPVIYVCHLCGITPQILNAWLRQGEDDFNNEIDTIHSELFSAIKKAQAEYVEIAVDDIKTGRPGWQGQAWVLERVRQEFMPKQEIKAGEDGKVTVVLGGKIKDIKNNDISK